MDILDRTDLPFPQSVPEFQRLSPTMRPVLPTWKRLAGVAVSPSRTAASWENLSSSPRGPASCGNPEVAGEFMPIIHLVFNNMKNWLNGIHHGVSPKHLQAYLNEFTFRFKRRFYPFNTLRSLLGIAGGPEPPTYPELHSGEWKHPTCSGALH